MKNQAIISVLLPFHHACDLLAKSIESIRAQTFTDWEMILMDNNADELCFSLAEKFVKHCNGKYIARMDSDDFSLTERLQRQYNFLEQNPDIGIVGCTAICESEMSDSRGIIEFTAQSNSWISEKDIFHNRFVESPFIHPTVMFRKELIKNYGGYNTRELPEDYELWLRWLEHGVKMAKLPEPLLVWNDHKQRLTRTHDNYSAEAFDRVRYYYLSRWMKKRAAPLPPVFVCGGGKLAKRKIRLLESFGISVSGIIDVKPNQIAGKKCITYDEIPPPGVIFIVSMVSNRGKYTEVRDFLLKKNYTEEQDFIIAA
jgi:glycosyltransferase involved in cell wall biosynthesis